MDRPRPNDLVSFVPMAAVDEGYGKIVAAESKPYIEVMRGYTPFKTGDVLFAKITPSMENGKAAVAGHLEGGVGFGSTEFHILRPSEHLLPDFLFHFIRQDWFRKQAAAAFTGSAGQQRVPTDFLARVKFPLPTLPEQRRIVDLLRQPEALQQARNDQSHNLSILARERFYDLFGHPAENPRQFDVVLLSNLGEMDRGVSKHRPRDASYLYGGSYPFIQTGDVTNAGDWITQYSSTYSDAGLAQSRLWPRGTLCITIAANIARAAILDFDACFPDSVVGFSPHEGIHAEYVLYCIRFYQELFEQRAPKSAQMNINLETLRTLHVPRPPEPMQRQFAEFVRAVRAVTDDLGFQHRSLSALQHEMSVAAFSGELSEDWREHHQTELRHAELERRGILGEFRRRTTPPFTEHTSLERPGPRRVPARAWLVEQLSEFQRNVHVALHKWKKIVTPDDAEAFDQFCCEKPIEHGGAKDRVRRSLEQLASLGLITKLSLRNISGNFVTGYRSLLENEDTRLADAQRLQSQVKRITE
jgi:type I restriction enzyme S subunit